MSFTCQSTRWRRGAGERNKKSRPDWAGFWDRSLTNKQCDGRENMLTNVIDGFYEFAEANSPSII